MKIPTTDQCSIHAFWGPRRETPEAIAARFLSLLGLLSKIDPVFNDWIWSENGKFIPFNTIRDRLPAAIADKVARADDGDPIPISGYRFFAVNSVKPQPRTIAVDVHAGSWQVFQGFINDAWIETPWRVIPDPAIVTFPILKPAVLALAESFDATWCCASTGNIKQFWGAVPPFFWLAWISYVSPQFAHLITPPETAIVERRPNGGLLMAATDQLFDVSNPAHLAAANDIRAAIGPLRTLSWPLDAEPAPTSAADP